MRPEHAQGDAAERFRRLFEENYRDVLAYALRRTAEPADAHDLAADVFLTAWRRLPDVPLAADEARMWLYGAARKLLANQERSRRRSRHLLDRSTVLAQQPLDAPGPGEAGGDAHEAALRALALLAPADRELVLLSVWEGLTVQELSAALGVSRATASVRLHRAKARLRRAFESTHAADGADAAEARADLGAARPTLASRRTDG